MTRIHYDGKEAQFRAALVSRGIFEMWHDKDYEDYVGDSIVVDTIKKHAAPGTYQGLILKGNNGTGKSMLMNIAFKHIFMTGRECQVVDFRDLVKEYTRSWRDTGRLPKLMTTDYLGIDDMGKEFGSDMSKELAITALDYVLRYRFQRQKPTWITTNLPLNSIKTEYNEHINSLLKRSTYALEMVGADYGDKLFTVYKKTK